MENKSDYPVHTPVHEMGDYSDDFEKPNSKAEAEVGSIVLHEDDGYHQPNEKEVFSGDGGVNFKTLPWYVPLEIASAIRIVSLFD